MNALDAVIVLAAFLAVVGGWRIGFVARVVSWAGLGAGIALAAVFAPDVADALRNASTAARLAATVSFTLGVALAGQALGMALGSSLHRRLPLSERLQTGDRAAGAALGVFGILVLVWFLTPTLATARGWAARTARDSAVVALVERIGPEPPRAAWTLARRVAGWAYLYTTDDFGGTSASGPPPTGGLPAGAFTRVAAAVVKVEGRACDMIQSGSGFAAAPELIVTNAHVVAGESRVFVRTADGRRLRAEVVAFDPRRDLAVLRVPGVGLTPLLFADGSVGATGAVLGHPGGGPLMESPARVEAKVEARTRDIYGTGRTTRSIFVLAARLEPGDSGGPLADRQGRVMGVAFAIDPADPDTAYAITNEELRPVLTPVLADPAGASSVPTGGCISG